MNITQAIARHIREIHFGGNWTWSAMQEVLADVSCEEAVKQTGGCNTIATLVYHMNFYLKIVHQRLEGGGVRFKHEDSFAAPLIDSEEAWQALLQQTWQDAENFAFAVEAMPEQKLWESISAEHGSYYKNLHGVVEHNHYHLGQIAVLKKIIREQG
jgi:DinB superfamily